MSLHARVWTTSITSRGIQIWSSAGHMVGTIPYADAQGRRDAELVAAAPELFEELKHRYESGLCGCGHPACSKCKDDAQTLEVLQKAQYKT